MSPASPYFGLLVRLVVGIGHCATENGSPMASARLPSVLVLDVPAWTPLIAGGIPCVHSSHSPRDPVVGRGTHYQCTAAQAGWRVSPRTVRQYLLTRPDSGRHQGVPSQRWRTFVRHHARAIVACGFCVGGTATFRLLYVFVSMEHTMRRALYGCDKREGIAL